MWSCEIFCGVCLESKCLQWYYLREGWFLYRLPISTIRNKFYLLFYHTCVWFGGGLPLLRGFVCFWCYLLTLLPIWPFIVHSFQLRFTLYRGRCVEGSYLCLTRLLCKKCWLNISNRRRVGRELSCNLIHGHLNFIS